MCAHPPEPDEAARHAEVATRKETSAASVGQEDAVGAETRCAPHCALHSCTCSNDCPCRCRDSTMPSAVRHCTSKHASAGRRGLGGDKRKIVASSTRGEKPPSTRRARRRRRSCRCKTSDGGRAGRRSRDKSSSDGVIGPAAKHSNNLTTPRRIVSFLSDSFVSSAVQCTDVNPQVRLSSVSAPHERSQQCIGGETVAVQGQRCETRQHRQESMRTVHGM